MPEEFGPEGTSSGSPEESVPTGTDLDRLLAEAADLAAEVTAEVGALPVRTEHGNIPIDTLEPDGTDIHDRMDELDHILDQTTSEVGLAVPESTGSSAPSGATPAMTVPDFMAEFTEPEPPAPPPVAPAAQTATTSPAAPPVPTPSAAGSPLPSASAGIGPAAKEPMSPAPIPDFMAEFTKPEPGASGSTRVDSSALTPSIVSRNPPKLGVVGSPVVPMAAPAELASPQGPIPLSTPIPKPAATPAQPAAPGAPPSAQSIPAAASPKWSAEVGNEGETSPDHSGVMLPPLAVWLVRGLEIVDRPFARLGPRSRRVAGWLALLLFAASCVVFAASLL